jgi:hypothetical protein
VTPGTTRADRAALQHASERTWAMEHIRIWHLRVVALAKVYEASSACLSASADPPFGFAACSQLETAVMAGPRPWPADTAAHDAWLERGGQR